MTADVMQAAVLFGQGLRIDEVAAKMQIPHAAARAFYKRVLVRSIRGERDKRRGTYHGKTKRGPHPSTVADAVGVSRRCACGVVFKAVLVEQTDCERCQSTSR